MNYESISTYFYGKRKWIKYGRMLYLSRNRRVISIHYGWTYQSSHILGKWYPNGKFKFKNQYYYPAARQKLNWFMPTGYEIISYRYHSFLREKDKEPRAFWWTLPGRSAWESIGHSNSDWVYIKDGKVLHKLGATSENIKAMLRKEDRKRAKPRRRGQYWTRKARGVFRKRCGKTYYEGCQWMRAWPRPTTPTKMECGCEIYNVKAKSHDTVKTIMAERNATVRTAKIKIYGVEKFFIDAKAITLDKEANYELLTINTGRADRTESRDNAVISEEVTISALRMTCPSTGQVYVNTVPPEQRTVRQALDWMYNTTSYLERVAVAT